MSTTSRSFVECVVLIVFGALLGSSRLQHIIFGDNASPSSSKITTSDGPSHNHAPQSLTYLDQDVQCPRHSLDIHIFSQAPLIVYISNFLQESEADELITLAEPHYKPSTVHADGEALDTMVRRSEKAELPRTRTVKCIEHRAMAVQGWPEDTFIERLSLQRYKETGFYGNHYDWATANPNARRTSTFMVYVFANCSGGGTNFPLLTLPKDPKWCEFVDCTAAAAGNADAPSGVTFLPKPGAAVFWQNFDGDGRGWKEGLHAGLPVSNGIKIGLNIWSWYQRGHKAPGGVTGNEA